MKKIPLYLFAGISLAWLSACGGQPDPGETTSKQQQSFTVSLKSVSVIDAQQNSVPVKVEGISQTSTYVNE